MCNTPAKDNNGAAAPAMQRRDESSRTLNSSSNFKDVELGALVKSSSQDSNCSESSQASAVSWLSLKALTNGKVVSACSLYSFCSVSMVLTNKSLASRYDILFKLSALTKSSVDSWMDPSDFLNRVDVQL